MYILKEELTIFMQDECFLSVILQYHPLKPQVP